MEDVVNDDSITVWIRQIRAGDETAAQQLWDRFFLRLTAVARQRMQGRSIRFADDEDIVLSAMKSVCLGLRRGVYPKLHCRESLWRLLLVITTRKAADQISFERRKKRDVNRLTRCTQGVEGDRLLANLQCQQPTPAMEAEVGEQLDVLLQSLSRADLQQIALLKMDGFTNEEIAGRLDRSVTTVERKLRTIRSIWSQTA